MLLLEDGPFRALDSGAVVVAAGLRLSRLFFFFFFFSVLRFKFVREGTFIGTYYLYCWTKNVRCEYILHMSVSLIGVEYLIVP